LDRKQRRKEGDHLPPGTLKKKRNSTGGGGETLPSVKGKKRLASVPEEKKKELQLSYSGGGKRDKTTPKTKGEPGKGGD